MPAWSLSGPILLALTAPAAGGRGPSVAKAGTPLRLTGIARPVAYRLPVTIKTFDIIERRDIVRDRRLDRALTIARSPVRDPQGDSVRALLRDRMARRGGGLDGRVEWRLSGRGSDVGLGGGVARVVDTLLRR